MGDALQRLRDWNAEIAIVLGSGLTAVVHDPVESIAYSEFSELPKPRVAGHAGIKKLVVTNAAGALNQKFKPGDWMMINDHLNLTGTSPLIGCPKFLDLGNAYSPRLQKHFGDAAHKVGVFLHQGVYAAVIGPQYETAAEARILQNLGADAVGMSTVLEVIQARALEMEVAGFSCVANLATGLSSTVLSHAEVLETSHKAAKDFSRILGEALPNL